jgi:UDP-N-acetylmuramoyl-tripeptide--D-alanyl-D-alanine ligase
VLPFSPFRAQQGVGAGLVQAGRERIFTAAHSDSRALVPGAIFFALQGVRAGESFFGEALKRKAGALVGRTFSPAIRRAAKKQGAWLWQVKDGLKAMQALAADQRRLFHGPVIAVTGSNGKTGAKDLLAQLLGAEPGLATEGNFNNHVGLPLTLLRLRPEHRWMVLELGMNHAGELKALGAIAKPTHAIELNVGDAHLGYFKTRARVADAKEELLTAMGTGGTAILNGDDPLVAAMGRRFAGRQIRFGTKGTADFKLNRIQDKGARGLTAGAQWQGKKLRLSLRQGGKAGQVQAAAALATALSLGLKPAPLLKRLAAYKPAAKLRQQVTRFKQGWAVLDAYNASPQSMQAGLAFLAASAPKGKRLAVLGCMLELGSAAPKLHRELGRQARKAGVRAVAALGPHAKDIAGGFSGDAEAFSRDQAAEAAAWLAPRLKTGDWTLFKGSRGMAVERVYQAMTGA